MWFVKNLLYRVLITTPFPIAKYFGLLHGLHPEIHVLVKVLWGITIVIAIPWLIMDIWKFYKDNITEENHA